MAPDAQVPEVRDGRFDLLRDRITKLENRQKLSTGGIVLLTVALVVTSFDADKRIKGLAAAQSATLVGADKFDVGTLRAKNIEVLDDLGKPSIQLDGLKSELQFIRPNLGPSLVLSGRHALGIAIYDAMGPSANINAGYIHLGGFAAGNDKSPEATVSVLDGASVDLTDRQGFRAVMGENDLISQKGGQSVHTSAAAMYLFNKEGNAIWHAPYGY